MALDEDYGSFNCLFSSRICNEGRTALHCTTHRGPCTHKYTSNPCHLMNNYYVIEKLLNIIILLLPHWPHCSFLHLLRPPALVSPLELIQIIPLSHWLHACLKSFFRTLNVALSNISEYYRRTELCLPAHQFRPNARRLRSLRFL